MGSVIGYQEAHGPVATFETDVAGKIKNLIVNIEPIQEGTGDPSPNNVRPISGWTGAKVAKCGKNLLDDAKRNVVTDTTVYIGTTDVNYNTFLKAGTYTISCDFEENYGMFYKKSTDTTNRTLWNSGTATRQATFTIEEDGLFRFWVYRNAAAGGVDASKIKTAQLELGSTATAYEPYVGSTYDIAFPSAAGTVYGGTLDVVKGELVVDVAQIASYNGETLPGEWISDRDVYAAGASPTTGAQVVYELATPITYQLTPQEINTIIGTNTIYADTGDTSVIYPKMITPVETVSNVNLMELRRNIIAAQGNDNLYNKWIWKQEKNDFVIRNNTVGFIEGLGNNIYIDQRSDRENNRRSIVVKRGMVPFVSYDSVSGGTYAPVKMYPIPIPPDAINVQMSCNQQNLIMGGMFLRLANGKYEQIKHNTTALELSRPLWTITGNNHFFAPYISREDGTDFTDTLENVRITFSRNGQWRWTLTNNDLSCWGRSISWDSTNSRITYSSSAVNNYKTIMVTDGLCGYFTNGELQIRTPVPVPPTATKVTVTTTPALQAQMILLKAADDQTQQLITNNGWNATPAVMTFTADDNLELAVALRVNSSVAAFTTSTTPTEIIIQFE